VWGLGLPNVRGYGLLVVLSIIWGLAFVAIRRADFELSPVNLTLLRWLIVSAGFLILYPFVIKPRTKFERRDLPRLLVVSLCGVVIYHLALNTAETLINASLAGLLISLAPLAVIIISAVVLHEKIRLRIWSALVLAIAGAALISSSDISLNSTTFAGPLLVVASAMASATFTVSSKPLTTKYGPFAIAAWSAFLGTAILAPLFSGTLISQAQALSTLGWASVLYLALLSTVLANLIFFTLVSRHQLSRLVIQLYLVPVVSAAGGAIILGETLAAVTVGGGALMLLAVALATGGHH
jgi:drug/metabolite transporter (DMT)-like permease